MNRDTREVNSWSYEATIAEVEDIINQVESGLLPLEAVFEQFEIAVNLLQQCEEFLVLGKQRMELFLETLEPDLDF